MLLYFVDLTYSMLKGNNQIDLYDFTENEGKQKSTKI